MLRRGGRHHQSSVSARGLALTGALFPALRAVAVGAGWAGPPATGAAGGRGRFGRLRFGFNGPGASSRADDERGARLPSTTNGRYEERASSPFASGPPCPLKDLFPDVWSGSGLCRGRRRPWESRFEGRDRTGYLGAGDGVPLPEPAGCRLRGEEKRQRRNSLNNNKKNKQHNYDITTFGVGTDERFPPLTLLRPRKRPPKGELDAALRAGQRPIAVRRV